MQRLHAGSLSALLPGGELWLDGGHNPHAAQAMADTLAARGPSRPVHLIFGMQGPRDAAATLAPFAGLAAGLVAVPVPGEAASRPTEELAAAARAHGIPAQEAADVETALCEIARIAPDARVLIFGSLYLAGAILAAQEGGAP
jgi:dihydrofolate synthase/folylpolyglutamate synthase